MNGYLRQSTAAQVRTIGPFIDDADFKTLENALTIANTDVKIKKNGAASGNKNSGGATADGAGGLYHLTWDATDTATVGELYFSILVSGSLAVFGSYTVLEEVVYDMMFAASAPGYVPDQPCNVTKWAGTTTTTGDIALKTSLAKTTHITGFNDLSTAQVNTECDTALADVGVTTTVTGRIDATVSSRATPAQVAIELTTYGALKPTTAGRTLDVTTTGEAGLDWANIGAPTTTQNLSATTISTSQTIATVTNGVSLTSGERTTLAGVIWNILTSTLTTVGSIGKLIVDNLNATVSSRSTYAGTDTPGTTTLLARVPTDPADASDIAASFTTVNGKLDTIDDFLDTEISAIKSKTDALPSDPADASDIASSFATVNTKLDTISGSVDTEVGAIKTTTDKLDTALELDGAVWRYTVNALEQAPAGGGGSGPTAAAIADAVWDEPMADHLTGGSTGASLNGAGAAGDPWTASLPGAYGAGTAGKIIGDNLNATVSSRATQSSVDTVGTNVTGIKGKTDNLPTDPADASDIAASFVTVNTKLDAIDVSVDGIDTTDWTDIEKQQIRHRIGIDGASSGPTQPPSLATQTSVLDVKAKTDNLPVDPADASDIASSFATVNTKLDAIDDFVDTEISAIKSKTDALPADPADASDIAASFTAVNAKLDTIDDFLDTEVGAIKSKTDNLPVDPADASDIATSFATVNTKLDAINGSVDTEVGAIKTVTDKLNTALEVDGPVWRYTTNALEQAPSGTAADPWAVLVPGAYAAGTAGKILGTNLDATVSSRMPTSSYVAPANADITAIKAKTDNLPAAPAAVSNIPTAAQNAAATRDVSNASPAGGSLGADVKLGIASAIDTNAIADAVLKRDWNSITGEANYSVLNALRFLRDKWEVLPDGTLKVYQQDGTTLAWQRTVTIDPNAEPITAVS